MFYGIQHGINALDGGNLDGTRGQTFILICIIRRVYREQLLPDTLQLELLQGKLDGGVSLQRHVRLQAVQIHACYHRLLGIVGRFLVNDAGQRTDFHGSQLHSGSLGLAFAVPEAVVLLLHTFQQLVRTHVPIHVVGVGHEHGGNRRRVVAVVLTGLLAVQRVGNGRRVEHQLLSQHGGQTVQGAHLGDGQVKRRLLTVLQPAEHRDGSVGGVNGISSAANVLAVVAVAE